MPFKPPVSNARPAPTPAGNLAYDPRIVFGLLGGLGLAELIVALAFSTPLGVAMGAATGSLVILAKVRERTAARRKVPLIDLGESAEALYVDPETGLPNRSQLIDQIAREIARAERYLHDLTLAVIEIERLDDLEAAWGTDVSRKAVTHVNQTLKRVTRSSDFLARVDDRRFAVILMQCNGEQARKLAERVELAVTNRPIKGGLRMRGVPVYVTVRVTALQYDKTRLRGPLDFLSRAGGELVVQEERRLTQPPAAARRQLARADAPNLRRELVRDYYPDGEVKDFADAYVQYRSHRAS